MESLGEIPINPESVPQSPSESDSQSQSAAGTDSGRSRWTPEAIAGAAVKILDVVCTKAWHDPLSVTESATLHEAFVPVAAKYFDDDDLPCELVALGVVAMVIGPRYLAGRMEEEDDDSSGAGTEGQRQDAVPKAANRGSLDALDILFGGGARPS